MGDKKGKKEKAKDKRQKDAKQAKQAKAARDKELSRHPQPLAAKPPHTPRSRGSR
jgi:hypothetical protein